MTAEHEASVLLLALFKGREDYFAQQHDCEYRPVRAPLSHFYLEQHLTGDATYGIYVLTRTNLCHFFCIDIDIPKDELKETDFADRAIKFAKLKQHLQDAIQYLTETLRLPREAILVEETGGRGYHIWILLSASVPGTVAVVFGAILKRNLPFDFEFFPKQAQLTGAIKLGNCIKLPLGIHRKYGGRSVFLTLSNVAPQYAEDLGSNIDILARVKPAEPAFILAAVSSQPEVTLPKRHVHAECLDRDPQRPHFRGDLHALVGGCNAMKLLRKKAENGQRLTRTEAFHFANSVLSAEGGQAYILDTMRASYAGDYNERQTLVEINKIGQLWPTSCMTLVEQHICPGFCREGVRKRNNDPLLTNTTPCGVWLTRTSVDICAETGDIATASAQIGNVKRAFSQLKTYHEHEDSLFFDPFDFEQFEKDFSSNCNVIAASLRDRTPRTAIGFLSVEIPKKVDSEYKLTYRKMSYSTVYEQVPIQAVFNIVGPLIEKEFQDCSFGYRWNCDDSHTNAIFEDWHDAYGRFHSQTLTTLRSNQQGCYICCDIKGYYDHVDQAILVEQLRGVIKNEHCLKFITGVVEMYQHERGQKKGLPQGPAYARLLANLYLNDFDKFASRHAKKYLRYVDDLFLFFDSVEQAERGLNEVVTFLSSIGLELSEADEKKPCITPNTDESRVKQSLDRIQYGILEGTRQLKNLPNRVVVDFSEAVERDRVSPETLDELIELNEYLPTLLYVVTEETLIPHPLRGKVWDIVKYLIEHHWFCPKRLKKVFYRLLDLSQDDATLTELFDLMDPVHRVYFILSVYGAYRSQGKHITLLEGIVRKAARSPFNFLRGFGIAIACRLDLRRKLALDAEEYINSLTTESTWFAPGKWVSHIDYSSLNVNERAALRQVVTPDSNIFLKLLLLSNLEGDPPTYVDGKYLCNIIDCADAALLPAVCSLIVLITTKSELFERLLTFAAFNPAMKASVVAMLSQKLFDLRANAGLAEIENLRALYEQLDDPEFKAVLETGLLRISGQGRPDAYGLDFAKCHTQLDAYNECFLFRRTGNAANYDYLELIPISRLRQYVGLDVTELKDVIEDLAEKEIVPQNKFLYDSRTEEIALQFRAPVGLRPVSEIDFKGDQNVRLRGLCLASQIFKKACYFHRIFGKAPFIHLDNLLVNETLTTIFFRTVGKSLCSPYLIEGIRIGDESEDIPKMVGICLSRMLVGDAAVVQAFSKASHTAEDAFVSLFMSKLLSKEPDDRYSCTRFDYLVDQLLAASVRGEEQVNALYMRERLKSELYRRNSHGIGWYGVSSAVSEHFTHLREICNRKVLNDVGFRDRLALALKLRARTHWLSRQLLNIVLNRGVGPTGKNLDENYANLAERLLIYSAISIEVLSLYRAICKRKKQHKLPSTFVVSREQFVISAAGYERTYDACDLASIISSCPSGVDIDAPPESKGLSLSQMMLHVLLSFDVRIDGDRICVFNLESKPDSIFRCLAHASLVRLPRIEEDVQMLVASVLDALRSSEEMVFPQLKTNSRHDLVVLSQDFERVRRSFCIRRCFGIASGKGYFPPDVACKSLLGRTITANESALLPAPLITNHPASEHRCSWDIQDGSIVNLVIPNYGISSVLWDLKSGRFFGVKIAYLYSGKMMGVFDIACLVILYAMLTVCEMESVVLKEHSVWHSFFDVISQVLVTTVYGLGLKLVLWDISHWIPRYGRFIQVVRAANDRAGVANL